MLTLALCCCVTPQPTTACSAEAQIQATASKLVQWTTARLGWMADQFASVAQGGAGGSTLQLPASVAAASAGAAAAPVPGNGPAPAPVAALSPARPSPVSSYSAGTVPLLG